MLNAYRSLLMRALPIPVLLVLFLIEATPNEALAADPPVYRDRWLYCQTNLQVEKSTDDLVALINRAAKAGYTAIVLADYKLNVLDRVPKSYFTNAEKVKKAAAAANIEIIPTLAGFGYSAGILAHDPNLAEGVPVKDAPFVVKNGVAVLESTVSLKNGGFEDAKDNKFAGLRYQDSPGSGTYADREVFASGKQSLRMQDTDKNCRVTQNVAVRPWACYRLSAKAKTRGFKPNGEFRLMATGANDKALTFHEVHAKPDQDWTEIEVVFNSLDSSEITVYLGVWGGLKGTLWLDDWKLEELSLVNVLRRKGCPFTVNSADGATTYEEDKDFESVKDRKLGQVPYAGEYSFNHPGAQIKLTANSRIKDGEKLHVSWYHPVAVHGSQVACSLSDPKVFEILADQAKRVNDLFAPKTWFLAHDEIRVTGWCKDAKESKLTPGQRLAANVKKCVEVVRGLTPKARVAVWSDMFDPYHNAVDKYYLVNGSWKGSWEGLPKDVIIANWNGEKAAESLKFFADRGHPQVIAGFYDEPGLKGFTGWDAAAKGVPGVTGFMYTTWRADFTQLEAYGKAMRRK
jgi:hypothetical protein